MEINKLKRFYKNKKIFLTGHTGFKGIWLYLILSFLGAKVVGFSLPLKNNDNFETSNLNNTIVNNYHPEYRSDNVNFIRNSYNNSFNQKYK